MLVGIGVARAQEKPLVAGQSSVERLFTVDLSDVGLAGNSAVGRLTLPPGIMTADHTHTGRNSLIIMVQGTLTEARGDVRREYKPGDVFSVAEGVTHHAENHGTVPVIYVEINTTKKN
ncbi:MAG: cupin domain-containing protein [Vicinamibacterales bacterium]